MGVWMNVHSSITAYVYNSPSAMRCLCLSNLSNVFSDFIPSSSPASRNTSFKGGFRWDAAVLKNGRTSIDP